MSILKEDNAIFMRYFTSKAKKKVFTTMIETRFNNSFTYSVKLNEGYPYHRCDPNSLVVLFISKWYTCITSISYLFSYLHVCHSDDSNWKIIHVNSNTLSRHWQFLRKKLLIFKEIPIHWNFFWKNAPRKKLFSRSKKH